MGVFVCKGSGMTEVRREVKFHEFFRVIYICSVPFFVSLAAWCFFFRV